jgi:predicted DNA-binding transcriptional regulator AlpA
MSHVFHIAITYKKRSEAWFSGKELEPRFFYARWHREQEIAMSRLRKKPPEAQQTPPTPPTPAGLLEVEEAAAWLKISRAKMFELMRDEKDFPVIRITEKIIRFDPNSLYKWVRTKQENDPWTA